MGLAMDDYWAVRNKAEAEARAVYEKNKDK